MGAEQITIIIVTSVITGLVSSLGTISALRERVEWIKESVIRAHSRLDVVEKTALENKISILKVSAGK